MNLQQIRESRSRQVAVVAITLAGLIHLAIAPSHWEHAPAHGLFFVLSAWIEVAWAVAFLCRPSRKLTIVGLVIPIGLIVLWGLSTVLPAPYGLEPEEIDAWGVVCKLTEAIGAVALAKVVFQDYLVSLGRSVAWQALLGIIVASFALSILGYGLARASEPLFPALTEAEGGHIHTLDAWAEAEPVSASVLAERSGIHVTRIGVTAMGSAIDVRFKVLNPDKATTMMEDHELMPLLVVEDKGTVLSAPDHGMIPRYREGLIYYMFYPNQQNVVESGTALSVVIGENRLDHVIVQ